MHSIRAKKKKIQIYNIFKKYTISLREIEYIIITTFFVNKLL
jgi:hypothetical protein